MAFSYSPKIVTDGLVLYLDAANPYSYVSGSLNWNDLSRSMLSGSLENSPGYSSANGGSIVFDGSNDYVDCGNQLLNYEIFTTNLWINWVFFDNSWRSPIGDGSNIYDYHILILSGNIYLGVSSNYTGSPFVGVNHGSINQNQWYNFTITKNSSNLVCFYKNGTLLSCDTKVGGTNINTIGKGYVYDNAKIPIVQFYNRALTPSEVLQNYNATKGRFGL